MIPLHSFQDFHQMLPYEIKVKASLAEFEEMYKSFYCEETQEHCMDWHDVATLLDFAVNTLKRSDS